MTRRNRIVLGIASLGLAAGLGYAIRAAASGIPATRVLSYAGVLEDSSGPITGNHNIQVILYDAATAGNNLCQSTATPLSITDGHFSVLLSDTCSVTTVGGNQNLWVDVLVDGSDTGRTKIGAVPYAVEANHTPNADNATTAATAQAAGGALAQQVVPSGAVMAFNLGACPSGWTALASAGGRTIIGVNPAGGNGLSQRNLGDTLGEETHQLTILEMPLHSHPVWAQGGAAGGHYATTFYSNAGNTDNSLGQGGDMPHNNMQPSLALLYCLKN